MSAATIMVDVNSYASIFQGGTTVPACKATPYKVITHLVKVLLKDVIWKSLISTLHSGTKAKKPRKGIIGPVRGHAHP